MLGTQERSLAGNVRNAAEPARQATVLRTDPGAVFDQLGDSRVREMIKFIDRDWASMGLDDPRGQYFRYWYGKTLATGNETMVSVPEDVLEWNKDEDNSFWTEETLEHMRD